MAAGASLAAALPAPASAACHFRGRLAILCSTGNGARGAFAIYGFDQAQAVTMRARADLQVMGCGEIYLGSPNHDIRLMQHGHLAGGEPVDAVSIDGTAAGYIAPEYLSGTCEGYQAPTWSVPPDPR